MWVFSASLYRSIRHLANLYVHLCGWRAGHAFEQGGLSPFIDISKAGVGGGI